MPDIPLDTADALAAWLATLPEPRPDVDEAIALALRDWLTGLGPLPLKPEPGRAH